MNLFKQKKGSLQDVVFIGIILLFVGVAVLIGFTVSSHFNDQVQSMSSIPSTAKTASNTLTGHYTGIIDNSFLLLVVGLGLVVLVLAALVRIHPIFIPFYFIGLLIVIFISGVLSNIYQEMAANTQISAYANQLVFISNILEVLPFIVGIFGILLMIVMYKLWSVAQNE